MRLCRFTSLVVSIAALLYGSAIAPSQQTAPAVFRLGTFNRSSGEFHGGEPAQNVVFDAGKSDAAKDWYAYQPAVSAAHPQNAVPFAPRIIRFSIAGTRAPAYRLHVAVLLERPAVPALRVDIDGRAGLFYLHPTLDLSGGDVWDSFNPAYSAADIEFDFPGAWLRPGMNSISLQPVEEAETVIPDAGLNYDAIGLDPLNHQAPRQLTAQIDPTIYFQNYDGLKEEVDVFLRYQQTARTGRAELVIGTHRYTMDIHGMGAFGDEKIAFLVSEFAPGSAARLTMRAGNRTQQFTQTIDPKKKWTLYVVPHIHTDVGYSDYQAKVAAIQSQDIDEALNLIAEHPDFRYSLDGEWDLQQFMAARSPVERQRVIAAIQQKRIFVPAQYASLLTGLPTAETLIRSLYPSANFSRVHGTPLNYANITDVPSYTWSYASILAAAGIPYLAAGSDNYRAPILLKGKLQEHSPMWWEGPDGGRVLLWYSRHYMQMEMLFGGPPLVAAGRQELPLFLQMYETPQYAADATIIFGTQVENHSLYPQQAALAAEWNRTYAYPHMLYSGFHEALAEIARQFGNQIPTVRGDGGPYWEDGAGSDARYLALERRNEARAPDAEKLATLASLADPRVAFNRADITRLWKKMVLMDEHTWDSWNSVSDPKSFEAVDQLKIKDDYPVDAAAGIDFLARRSMAALANRIAAGRDSLIVFNTLNWQRSGMVTFDLPHGEEIVEAGSGKTVPVETVVNQANLDRVRFLAHDVPALGYRVYTVRQAAESVPGANPAENPAAAGDTLENSYYKIELDPESGALRSIYDKQLHRELVNEKSTWRFGQYLYVTGGDTPPNTILHYDRISPQPKLTIHPAQDGKLFGVTHTPFGEVAQLRSQATNTPAIRTEIILFNSEKKIEIVEHLDKTATTRKEAAYFAFPFAIANPRFRYEIQNGSVDPAHDMLPGAGLEWFSVQHWVAVEQNGVSAAVMPLDAPLVTLGDINRGAWPQDFGERPANIFSYVMNNYWDTNYRAEQGGRFTFRYVITSAEATQPAELSRMGWEEATPLEQDLITTQDKLADALSSNSSSAPPLDATQASLLQIEDPDVLLDTWKAAEDGNGTILRLIDLGGATRTVHVRSPLLRLKEVTQTDALERGGTAVEMDGTDGFHFTIHPHQIATLRIVDYEP